MYTADSLKLKSRVDRNEATKLQGPHFGGWAICSHLQEIVLRSGSTSNKRTPFAEKLYRYLFHNERLFQSLCVQMYVQAIHEFFGSQSFDGLLMIPSPIDRIDYRQNVILNITIAKETRLPSMHHYVKQLSLPQQPRFEFASPAVRWGFADKNVLVLTDFFRSGTTVHEFCRFLRLEGKANELFVLAGTILKPIRLGI
jgi:hypothetical protein